MSKAAPVTPPPKPAPPLSPTATTGSAQPSGPQITTTEQTGIHFSQLYLHSVPGVLKVVCLICVLLGFFLTIFSKHSGDGVAQFFCTIVMICFWFSGILLVLYLFHVVYVTKQIPWNKVEFFFCTGAALFLMLTSALMAGRGPGLFVAASFFGFVAMCAYGYDAFLKYKNYNIIYTGAVT